MLACLSCLRVDLIICTLPLVQRADSILRVLVQINAFSLSSIIQTALRWSQNYTGDSILCSTDFYRFLKNKIHPTNPYETFIWFLQFYKRVAKISTAQTSMESLCGLYAIKIKIVGTSKGLDIKFLTPWLIHPGYQVLHIKSHKKLHIHLRIPNMVYRYSY